MIALVVIVGVILAVAFSLYLKSGEKAVVRSEVSYFIIVLLLALPVLLVLLFIALATDKKEVTIERSEDVFGKSLAGQMQPTGGYPVVIGKAKDQGDEEEGRSRFCMLCALDANRARPSASSP